jgi:peptidyl-prolyl cis-trans isomerase SurA
VHRGIEYSHPNGTENMRSSSVIPAAVLAAALLVPSAVLGQVEGFPMADADPRGEVVDRVVAVVGDSIVLHSQVNEELMRMQMAGQPVPTDPQELRELEREITGAYVNQLLLAQAAERDTLVDIPDSEVDDIFREAWDGQVQALGGEANLREALAQEGLQLERYREESRAAIRRNLLVQTYMQMQRARLGSIVVDEQEVREFYDRERERFGERPATLTVRHLFFQPTGSDEARAEAKERAEDILRMIREGEDFSDLARRFSDDTDTRQQGGDLGWWRRGDGLVEEFEDVAFRMGERQVSGVVETDYGAHIIRIERVRGPERKINHILIAAEPAPEDEERLRERLQDMVREVREGRDLMEFSSEATRFGIADSLTLPRDRLEEFPREYAQAVATASEGDVLGPVDFPLSEATRVYAVVHVKDIRSAGVYTFEDVRDQIRNLLREEKLEERILGELRARTYVDIRL